MNIDCNWAKKYVCFWILTQFSLTNSNPDNVDLESKWNVTRKRMTVAHYPLSTKIKSVATTDADLQYTGKVI